MVVSLNSSAVNAQQDRAAQGVTVHAEDQLGTAAHHLLHQEALGRTPVRASTSAAIAAWRMPLKSCPNLTLQSCNRRRAEVDRLKAGVSRGRGPLPRRDHGTRRARLRMHGPDIGKNHSPGPAGGRALEHYLGVPPHAETRLYLRKM